MASVMTTLDTMIREELPMLFMESLPDIDPVYEGIIRTSQSVERDKIGRGWKVKHRFRTSLSGQYEGRNIDANAAATSSAKQLFAYGTLAAFPKPENTPHRGSVVRTIGLNNHRGNFSLPTFVLKAGALSPIVARDIADDLSGLAELRAQMEAVSFYMNSTGYLGVVSALSFAAAAHGHTVNTAARFAPTSSRIRWWQPGMLVNLFSNAAAASMINEDGGTNTTVIPTVVDSVDYVNGTVVIKHLLDNGRLSGDTGVATHYETAVADGNYVFPAWGLEQLATSVESTIYRIGHNGLESWIKSSGQIMDATMQGRNDSSAATWDLVDYPQFKSILSTISGPLTDTVLNENIGAFIEAYGSDLDTIITTRKVIQKYLEAPTLGNSRMNYDRTGKSLAMGGGWNKVTYEYEGRTFDIKISPYCQAQTMYIVKMGGGNIKRYVPPRASGIGGIGSPGSGMEMGEEIEFIAPYGGSSSIFMLTRDSSGNVEPMVEAPFEQYSQIAPIDVRSIKLSSLTESN